MSNTSPGSALRAAVAEQCLQVPGAPNALAARLIERCGFGAAYISGAAFSAGIMGIPDIGLFTLTELTQHVELATQSCNLPLIVDADTGFGGEANVRRTIANLELAGAAAIQLEDQDISKKCGHLHGKQLIETDAMCDKLRAAAAARSDHDLVLIARTDARGVNGMDDALWRAERYLDAGADWIFPEALETPEEFATFGERFGVPLLANMTEFGKSPLLTNDELSSLGYAAVLYPVTLLRIAMKAMETALAVIGSEGSQQSLLDLMQTREELYELLDYDPNSN